MDKLFVTLGGIGLIVFIYWFFFGKRYPAFASATARQGSIDIIDILVDGGYKPENIKIKKDKTTKLIFKRTDPNSCLEEIVIPDFKIKEYLPLNKKVEIVLTPENTGTYQTNCGMNMFHGKIIVE